MKDTLLEPLRPVTEEKVSISFDDNKANVYEQLMVKSNYSETKDNYKDFSYPTLEAPDLPYISPVRSERS